MSSMPILSAAQMRACDTYTMETLGVPSQVLMERAARKAADLLLRHPAFPAGKVLLLCGSGNNGGDGFAAARFLADGSLQETRPVVIIYTGRYTEVSGSDDSTATPDTTRMSRACARQYELAAGAGIPVLPMESIHMALDGAATVVDAVFGIGLDRPISGEIASLLEAVAASGLPVLAMDIPSGVHADTGAVLGVALTASVTATMQALKAGLMLYPGADRCGEIFVCDIGIDLAAAPAPMARLANEARLQDVLPPRKRRSHKGTYGRIALLCGSTGMGGAAILAARAALRTGGGLAEVITPPDNRIPLQTAIPEAIVTTYAPCHDAGHPLPAQDPLTRIRITVREAMQRADCALLGCGLGTDTTAHIALATALTSLHGDTPLVLDADALNLLAADPDLWDSPALRAPLATVLTPHPAEMARLCGCSAADILEDLPRAAKKLAHERGVTVVLKDAHTVIASPDGSCFICAAGNAGMSKGGSGDVLAGIIASLLSQNRARIGQTGDLTVAEAAAAGVYLHAAAGDLAAQELGEYSLLPSDLIAHLPAVLRDHSNTRTVICD